MLKGVLFAIKQLDNLEYLFHLSLEQEPLRILIVNSRLEILATNAAAREYLGSGYYRGIQLPDVLKQDVNWDFLSESLKGDQKIQYQYENTNKQMVVQHPVGINDWHLIVAGDKDALAKAYGVGQKKTNIIIILFVVISWAVFVYLSMVIFLNIYRRRQGIENIRFEQERNAILLDKLNCDFFDYNIATEELKIRDHVYTRDTLYQLADNLFAGFDDNTFRDALDQVKATGTTYTFDVGSKGDNIWHRIVLSPFKDRDGRVTYVFGSILDRTREHVAMLKSAEMTSVIDAFAKDFECLYVVNLTTNSFKTINSSGEFGEIGINTEGDDFFDVSSYDYRTHIYHDDYEYVCSMVNKEKIISDLKTSRDYIFNYRVVHNGQPIYYQFRGMLNANDSNILYVGIRNIDASIRHEADMLQKEKAYRNAITSSCVLYGNINLSKDTLIDFYSTVNSANPKEVDIPLEKPYSYSKFLEWCAEKITSSKESFLDTCNSSYLISAFNSGMPYVEIQYSTKFFNQEERTLRFVFFVNRNTGTGNIMALLVAYDITEMSQKTKQVEDLQEALKEARFKNSMSQMQPHFLYNALGSIREIILDDPQYASDLVYDFTTHLRACIKAMSNSDLIPFEQELTNINAYVNIEKMRFGDRLKVVYDIQKSDFKIVPLGIQPLVENSIRHGVYK
ncbi:MAG: histidine kinase, partial [Spirochaetales bacterium]|nr:histidine kinase [Spirochaetales bacterium]